MWESWVEFYLGQNEDYSLGGSISDSTVKLLLRGRGEGQDIHDFGEGGSTWNQTQILAKVAASHEQTSPWRILGLFYIKGDARIGLIKSSENIYLNTCCASCASSQCASFQISARYWFRWWWGLAAAVAHDSVFVEADGKSQAPVHKDIYILVLRTSPGT